MIGLGLGKEMDKRNNVIISIPKINKLNIIFKIIIMLFVFNHMFVHLRKNAWECPLNP